MDFRENIDKENLKDVMSLNPFSHIKGLGIGNFINLTKVSQGYVGQKNVRRALFMFVNLINQQNFENRGLIVTGPSGTGKSSLGIAISKLLFPKFPFVKINGSEIGSSIIPKTEFLHQIIRKTIGICFYQESLIIEGEVVELNLYDEGQKKRLVIRNQNIQSIYELGPKIFKKFLQKKIKKGDFVSIDKVNGEIHSWKKNSQKLVLEKKKNFQKNRSNSLERYKIIEHFITLHEIDILNSKDKKLSDLFSDYKSEIGFKKRNKIEKILKRWEEEKKIKIFKGILFIDDVNFLSNHSFSFLGKIIESKFSPNFFLVSEFIKDKINQFNFLSPLGIPIDFSDRFLTLSTYPSSKIEIEQIIKIKLKNAKINIEKEGFFLLVKVAIECGLIYTLYLIGTFYFHPVKSGEKIKKDEILISFKLFMDYKRTIRNTNLPKYFLYD